MREIHPLGLVPYSIIMNALAYQVGKAIYYFWTCTRTLPPAHALAMEIYFIFGHVFVLFV